jgi:hypothetical protein
MELARIEVNDFGGSPVAEHNMPCAVCGRRKAVIVLNTGIFEPCWTCQKTWELRRSDPNATRRWILVCLATAFLGFCGGALAMSGDLNRLLDNGVCVTMFKNQLGSYTAFAVRVGHEDIDIAMNDADEDGQLTDDFTPEAAMKRLADKVMRVGDYAENG